MKKKTMAMVLSFSMVFTGNHIAEVINRDLKLSIRSMNLSPGGGLLSGVIHVEVPGTGMVDMLIHSILRIKGVQKAYRVNN